MNKDKKDQQLRFLAQSIRLKEAASPRLVRATMAVVSLSVLGFIGWAAFANIHEIARTPGEVVPTGFQQVVQHLEGGIVREILVQEGDTVEKEANEYYDEYLNAFHDALIKGEVKREACPHGITEKAHTGKTEGVEPSP